MNQLNDFTVPTARPLPVIVLADVSGSMSVDGKIDALNNAVSEMISSFAVEDDNRAEIHVSVVTFGLDGARIHKELKPASSVTWDPMKANGKTPMGEAFTVVRKMVEDRDLIPSRAYRPTIVLVSDGMPTDEWRTPLEALLNSERASKAMRFAMGIGADADETTLKAFLDDSETKLFQAHEAREISKFFKWVTMSVTSRSRSANPNDPVSVEPSESDEFDY